MNVKEFKGTYFRIITHYIGVLERYDAGLLVMLIEFNRLKIIVEEIKPEDPTLEERFNQKAMAKVFCYKVIMIKYGQPSKLKHIETEFRDSINSWIEDTLEQIDKKKNTKKTSEAEMVKIAHQLIINS